MADFSALFFLSFLTIFLVCGGAAVAGLVAAPLSFFLVSPPPRLMFCNGVDSGSIVGMTSVVDEGRLLMKGNLRIDDLPTPLGEANAG